MKVKFVHTLLVAAAFVSAAGAFVSCKDYESDDIQEIRNQYANATALSQDLSNRLTTAEGNITALQHKVDTLKNCHCDLKNLQNQIDALADSSANYSQYLTNYGTAIKNLQNQFNNYYTKEQVNAGLDTLKTTLEDLRADLLDSIAKGDSLNHIADRKYADSLYYTADENIKEVTKRVSAVEDNIKLLKKSVINLFSQAITDVTIQGTYTPAFGSLSLPLDIQSNLLVTYYGNNTNGEFKFPTNDTQYLTGKNNASITAADLAGAERVTIPAGTLLDKDGAEGNAGDLYVTVNPQEVNLADVDFALVKSNGKESDVKLAGAGNYDEVLTWGYTRAGSPTKVIKATITKDALDKGDVKVNIKRDGLRSAVKKALTDHATDKQNIKDLAKTTAKFIYDNLNSTVPRLGISTKYNVSLDDENNATLHNVSKLDILAAAVNPAGFNLLDNVSVNGVPGLETAEARIKNFIDGIKLGTITVDITNGKTIKDITEIKGIGEITINAKGEYVIPVTVAGTVNGQEVTLAGSVDLKENGVLENLLGTIEDGVNAQLTDLDTQLKNFNSSIKDLNSLIADLNKGYTIDLDEKIAGTKADLENRLDNYISSLNNTFATWFNRATGAALKPVLLFDAGRDVHRFVAGEATVSGSSIRLVPTSYTRELIAPAYKKYIHVYAAGHDAYNKVFDGDTREITVPLKSGKKYTIVYEAVDYSGNVAAKKYTLNVK